MPPHSPLSGTERGDVGIARRRVNEKFLFDLLHYWADKGPKVIEKVGEEMPATLVKCMVMLCPKEMRIETTNPAGRLTDEQLALMIGELRERIDERLGEKAKLINAEVVDDGPKNGLPGHRKRQPKSTAKELEYARQYYLKRKAEKAAAKAAAASPSLPQNDTE